MLKKSAVTEVRDAMHQDIISNKKDHKIVVFFILFIFSAVRYFPKALLLNTINIPTPVEIATSAMLKIALKNVK